MGRTSLSAGMVIREILTGDEAVMGIARKVFPVAVDKAELPYVAYRRASLEHNPSKAGMPGADAVRIEVGCYAETYEQSVSLAEAVRSALDYGKGGGGGMRLRSCTLVDADEAWADDCFVQRLAFVARL